jgi:hypothetical protein
MDRMVTGSTAVLSFVLCAFCLAQEPPQPPQKEPAANQTPEQLYQQLGSGKPSEVFAAMKALSDPGTGAVQFLAGKLQEGFSVGSEEETKIAREKAPDLIALLGNDDFEVREKATQELIALGKAVVPIVTEVLNSSDPEVATRARTVLDEIGKKNSDATRNTLDLLTVSLLGRLGGPEAVKASSAAISVSRRRRTRRSSAWPATPSGSLWKTYAPIGRRPSMRGTSGSRIRRLPLRANPSRSSAGSPSARRRR